MSRKSIVPGNTSGFTLLEVILAVALSTLIIASIATAIRLNLVLFDRQQAKIEQSLVARNVAMMITQDIRSAIQYKPADVTGISNLEVSTAAAAGLAASAGIEIPDGLTGGSGGGSDGGNGGGNDASGGGDTTVVEDYEPPRPLLFGNEFELQFDISRLPRIDQYSPMVTGQLDGNVSLPSDVKTVAYFVSQQNLDLESLQLFGNQTAPGGLFRREADRAVVNYASAGSGFIDDIAPAKLIAPEIVQIRFRYFDGESWMTEWDSEVQGGFPSAIEVIIVSDETRMAGNQGDRQSGDFSSVDPTLLQQTRSVVYLPIAEIMEEEEAGTQ